MPNAARSAVIGQHQRHERRDEGAERDQQDDERDRERQAERPVEVAVDELLDVLVGERPVERVDPQVRVTGPELVQRAAASRRAGHRARRPRRERRGDPNGRAVGRDEARPRWRQSRIDDSANSGSLAPSSVGRRRRHLRQDVVECRHRRRAVGGRRRRCSVGGRCLQAAYRRAEDVVGAGRLVRRLVIVITGDGIGGLRAAGGQARHEQADR